MNIRPEIILRAEWLVAACICLLAYHLIGASWWLFALLVLVPDLSMLGYLAGPRVGAICYNIFHALIGPLLTIAYGWTMSAEIVLSVGVIWLFHVVADRAIGYGLKLPTGFRDTHLGRIGRD